MQSINSLLLSIPFIPGSFWKLSKTAKLARLTLLGLGTAGVVKGVRLVTRRITHLEKEVSKLTGRIEEGEGEAGALKKELGALRGELEEMRRRLSPLESARDQAASAPPPPEPLSLEASYAHVATDDEFAQRLEAWGTVFKRESLRAFLQDKQQRNAFRDELLKLTGLMIDQTAMKGLTKSNSADHKKELQRTLTVYLDTLAAAEDLIGDQVFETVGKALHTFLQETFPKLFALVDGTGRAQASELLQVYRELPTLLPRDDSEPDWVKSVASKAGWLLNTDTLYLAIKAGLPTLIEKDRDALKKLHSPQNTQDRQRLHVCIDAAADLLLAGAKIVMAIAHDHKESRAGEIFWGKVVEIAKNKIGKDDGMDDLLADEVHFLRGRDGAKSTLGKTIAASQSWYEQVFKTEEPLTPQLMLTLGQHPLVRAFDSSSSR